MEKRKAIVDLQQIDLLEQKIVKATELIRSLRRERDAAVSQAGESAAELVRLQKESAAELVRLQKESAGFHDERIELREATEQIEALQQERQTVRGKVQRMLEMMSYLDETPTEAHRDH